MSSQAAGYVTDVPYDWVFTWELSPACLDHVALISGFAPPAREDEFAWCDLGCGHGLTANILAATHPKGRFCGIDFLGAHIRNARRFAGECKIENVEFHEEDFAAAAKADFGQFDYIVCHGVYTYLDAQGRNALLRTIDRHLKPGGLVYLSYYAMPGRAADLPFQRLMRTLGRTLPGDSGKQCVAALDIVQKLSEFRPPALVASPMAARLKEHPVSVAYLAHELMPANWEPFCVTDVRAAMRRIGLMPVGSATLIHNYDSFVLGQAARTTLAAISDPDARELARDFLIDQAFRRDVYVRAGRALDEDERRSHLLASCFALTGPADTIEYATRSPAGRLRYDNPVSRAVVAVLAGGPRPLAEISTEVKVPAQNVLANALVLAAAVALRPVERNNSPVANLNKAIYRRLGALDEIRFLALPCGTALRMQDVLLSLIKGGEAVKQEERVRWESFLAAYGV
jgi:SAM-dependent methyltransferase